MTLWEQKKKEIRQRISNAATQLFIDRGFGNVTIDEVATAAGVSRPTVFNYFSTKESLVFDEDTERERWITQAVSKRVTGQSILSALSDLWKSHLKEARKSKGRAEAFRNLIQSTPALQIYRQQMWQRYHQGLSTVIRKESQTPIDRFQAEALAGLILDLFSRSEKSKRPIALLRSTFQIIARGWDG